MVLLLQLFIFICSSFFIIGRELRHAQELFYQVGGLALLPLGFLLSSVKLVKPNKASLWIGLFGVYSALLFLLSEQGYGAPYLVNIIIGIMLYFMTIQLEPKDTRRIITAVIAVCCANMLWQSLQAFNLDPVYMIQFADSISENANTDLVGLLGLKAVIGMWCALGLLACMFFNIWLAPLFLIPIYMAKSSGVIIGLSVSVPFLLYYINRRLFKIALPLLILAGIAYIVFVDNPMGMMATRPSMWKLAVRDTIYCNGTGSRFLRNPITGFGLDSWRNSPVLYFSRTDTKKAIRGMVGSDNILRDEKGQPFKNTNGRICAPDGVAVDLWDNPHNEMIQLFREFGLIGIFIIGMAFYQIYKRFAQTIKTNELLVSVAMLLCLMLMGISQFPFHLARIGFMIPILAGLCIINSEPTDEENIWIVKNRN